MASGFIDYANSDLQEMLDVIGEQPLPSQCLSMYYLPTPQLPSLQTRGIAQRDALVSKIAKLDLGVQGKAVHTQSVIQALLMYAVGAMDEAHNLVLPLSWPSPTEMGGRPISKANCGSATAQDATYVHAMLHRQEGKFIGQEGGGMKGWDNADFWFSRTGDHPVYRSVLKFAKSLDKSHPQWKAFLRSADSRWPAHDFLALHEQAVSQADTQLLEVCTDVMNLEWRLLLDHCVAKLHE